MQNLNGFDSGLKDQYRSKKMPLSKYFSGHGQKVMKAMKEQYGEEKGKQVFYATANKQKQGKEGRVKKAFRRGLRGKT